MSYINVGASDRDGRRIPSKAALKKMLAEQPSEVIFDPTAYFGSQEEIAGDTLIEGSKLQVCGPDPYDKRSWYATVTLTEKGIKVT